MKSVGIICEYNPFHYGHLYHLNKIKEQFPNHVVILIMSNTFMQRGETSLLNKWTKTELALKYGIDLVIELPFVFASQSADIFARGSIQLLNHLKVKTFVFGSETNDLELLGEFCDLSFSSDYHKLIKKYLNKGYSYPKASANATDILIGKTVSHPNDILAISYLKEIKRLNSKVKPICIRRNNEFISASEIRNLLKNKKEIKEFIPDLTYSYLNNDLHFIDDYFPFLKYKILTELNNLHLYHMVDEGIENRIKKYIIDSNSLEELIFNIKTKRYTYNKIARMLTHILCDFTKEEVKGFKDIEYIRVLGFTTLGRKYLNSIKKEVTIPLITNYSKLNNNMLALEFRATCVYASILNDPDKKILIEQEYKNKPITF